MKICFVLNQVKTETCGTSVIILKKAVERGHQVYVMGVGDFIFYKNKGISLRAKKIPSNLTYENAQEFWSQVQSDQLEFQRVPSQEMDIVFLRNNPTEENSDRRWAQHSALAFGRMMQNNGVLVLNDAMGLSAAYVDKLYFEELPKEIKPDSLISRNKKDILEFWEKQNNLVVLKPLEGSGGQDVYKIGKGKRNVDQILDTILKKGYVIAQEYLPAATKGDMRVILVNGKILEQDGQSAIIHRVSNDKSEFRSNLTLGGIPKPGKLTPEIEHIVSVISPKIIEDGLFFVGLDIVEDKLIEINVLSPGGIDHYEITGMSDFTESVVKALERKVEYKKENPDIPNSVLATKD